MVIMAARTQERVILAVLLLVGVSLFLPFYSHFSLNLNMENESGEDQGDVNPTSIYLPSDGNVMVTRSAAARADEGSTLYFKENKYVSNVEVFSNSTIIFHRNLTIASGGKITFMNCTLLSQNNSMEKSILVEKGGMLVLEDVVMSISNASTVNSSVLEASVFSLESRGYIEIADTTIKNYRYFNIIDSDSLLEHLRLETSRRDGVYFKSSNSRLDSFQVISPALSGINCALSNLTIKGLTIENAGENGMYIKNSTVNLTSALLIGSEKAQLDIGLATTVVTDNATIRDMKINFRDSASKVIVQGEENGGVITKPKESSSSSERLTTFLVGLAVVLLLILLIFGWVKTRALFQKVSEQSFGYEGEKLDIFKRKFREGQEPPKEEQKDILFEFGKMAMNAGTHSKALSYFAKMVSACENEKETYGYLVQIYDKAKNDPDILEHYRELLSPIFSMKEDQADVLFEFGKMAMNSGEHNKALAYFTKMEPLCENEKEWDSYLQKIHGKVKNDPEIMDKYRLLLAPVFAKDEDAEKQRQAGTPGDEGGGLSPLSVELDDEEGTMADTPMTEREKSSSKKEQSGAKGLANAFRKALKK